jgi:hypothetical protein
MNSRHHPASDIQASKVVSSLFSAVACLDGGGAICTRFVMDEVVPSKANIIQHRCRNSLTDW